MVTRTCERAGVPLRAGGDEVLSLDRRCANASAARLPRSERPAWREPLGDDVDAIGTTAAQDRP